jgi:hypothetical protein
MAHVTNAVLVDTNNKAAKLTNLTLSLRKMRENGEVGDIHLGMTMDEVVARWGKPFLLAPMCGNDFLFGDCSLHFRGDSFQSVYFDENAVFDHGLSARSNLKQWTNILGQPSRRDDDRYGTCLVYETRAAIRTVLYLTFDPDGDTMFPPHLVLDPITTNWVKPSQP